MPRINHRAEALATEGHCFGLGRHLDGEPAMRPPFPRTRALHRPTWVAKIALAAFLVSAISPRALAQTSAGTQGSQPSSESVRALVMNNWSDSLAIHYARQLYPKDSHVFGPYLVALRSKADWTVNQIDGATAFFHAEVLGGNTSASGQPNGPERPVTLCESSGDPKGDDLPADPGCGNRILQSCASMTVVS
jgi:hypothetical protein